uniref:Uncharacterized protein n=1 Tax=Panagrolaimus superbus TaxID=310955 RepID=A0A914YDU4_9BILA
MEEIEIFSTQEKGFLYSIVAIGCLISSLTVMKMIDLTDGRFTFTLYTTIGGIATLCLPMCAKNGFLPVLIARGFQVSEIHEIKI